MKKLLMIALLALTASCATIKTGTLPSTTDNVVNTKTSKENYVAANEWMVDAFTNADDVIQFSDKESGTVKGKYTLNYVAGSYVGYGISSPSRNSKAVITVKTRDNGAKITITPLDLHYVKNPGFIYPTLHEYGVKIVKLMAEFKTYMEDE